MQKLREDIAQYGRAWLPIILSVVFGMQLLRVLLLSFVGYLRDSLDISSLDLAPVAIGIFALSLFAALLNRLASTKSALWISAGGLALIRLIEQFISTPSIDLYLSAVGVVLFFFFIPIAIGSARAQAGSAPRHFALAFLLGLSFDSAIFIAAKTLDLSWQSGLIPSGIVFILVGLHLSALSNFVAASSPAEDSSWKNAMALLALGPWLFLQTLLFQNTGFYGSLTGFLVPAAGLALLAVNGLAIYSLPLLYSLVKKLGAFLVLSAILLVAIFLLPNSRGILAMAWLLIAQFLSYVLGYAILQSAAAPGVNVGLARSSTMHGIGQILFVLLIFVYYASYDISFGIRSGIVLIVGTVLMLLALLPPRSSFADAELTSSKSPAWIALALLIFPFFQMLTTPAPSTAAPASDRILVLDYNVHNAVNTAGSLDPEALALIIENSGADIIAFQEFSRGWLTWGGLDMLSWFAERLDMYYVWGPTGDAQWGNALFSRYPIEDYELLDLPSGELLLLRGHINASIDIAGNSLNVIVTHFSHRDDQGPERLQQASAILSTWNSRPATIVMGDLNAEPQSEEIMLLTNHGLVDISAEIGSQPTYTYYADNPDHQIDYILVSPDLAYSDFKIYQTSASDHLPLAATIHLGD